MDKGSNIKAAGKKKAITLGVCLKAIFLLTLCCSFDTQTVFAIEEVKPDFESLQKTAPLINEFDYEKIFNKAVDHSYDLKIADYEIMISKTGITSARSQYFPKLVAMAGTEYTHNLKDNASTYVMTVGDAYINPYTRYQTIFGLNLYYNVFDFGIRGKNLKIAKEDVNLKTLQEAQALQELELTIVDLYTKIAVLNSQIQKNNQILDLENKNLEFYKRLYNAKEVSKTDLNDAENEVARTRKTISELKQMLSENLYILNFYTGEEYAVDNLKIKAIKNPDFDPLECKDYSKTIIWKIFDSEIKKKDLELKIAKKNNYPKVNAYGRYYLYGSDHSSYPDAFKDISQSNYTFGLSASKPVFDGFSNSALIKKTALELEQLNIKRDKSVAQWLTRLATLRSNLSYLTQQIEENKTIIKESEDKEKSKAKLLSKKLITPIELNNAKIEVLKEQIELDKNTMTRISVLKGIEILTRGMNEDRVGLNKKETQRDSRR